MNRPHTLLFVDDEEHILSSLKRLFRKHRFEILTSSSGPGALGLIEKLSGTISLIIADQKMPGMTGSEFLSRSLELSPHSRKILLTGYADLSAVADAVNRGGIDRYITKPWNDISLVENVMECLTGFEQDSDARQQRKRALKQSRVLFNISRHLKEEVGKKNEALGVRGRQLVALDKRFKARVEGLLRSLSSLTEVRAPQVSGHGLRVSLLARHLAEKMGLSSRDAYNVEVAALLHDIGKADLPVRFLLNDYDALNHDDRKRYRTHPSEGFRLVSSYGDFEDVGPAILYHHERWDGKGFPEGLAADGIPLGARIVSVINVFDRITGIRVNSRKVLAEFTRAKGKTASSVAGDVILERAASHYLQENSGKRFDPEVVHAFVNIMQGREINAPADRQVDLVHLLPGMVLSRPVFTEKGRFMLPQRQVISRELIERLRVVEENDPVSGGIFVLK